MKEYIINCVDERRSLGSFLELLWELEATRVIHSTKYFVLRRFLQAVPPTLPAPKS